MTANRRTSSRAAAMLASVVLSLSATARAQDDPEVGGVPPATPPAIGDADLLAARCAPPERVVVDVAPSPEPSVAEKVKREVASELDAATMPCWPTDDLVGPTIDVQVRWPDPSHARVVIIASTTTRVHYGIRDLDLEKLPPDGVALAIAISADELLETIAAEASGTRAPAPHAPPAVVLRPRAVAKRTPPRRWAFGPALAFDVVGSGLPLVGPDAQAIVPLADSFALAVRVGSRTSTNPKRRAPLSTSGAWLAGANLRVGPQDARSGFGVSAGLDVMRLSLATPRESASETLVLGRVGVGAFMTIADALRLTVDAYVGGTLGQVKPELRLTESLPADSLGEGIAAGGSIGLGALF